MHMLRMVGDTRATQESKFICRGEKKNSVTSIIQYAFMLFLSIFVFFDFPFPD